MQCKKCAQIIPEGSIFCNFCGRKQITERSGHRRGNGQGCVYKRTNGRYRAVVTVGSYEKDGKLHRVSKCRDFAKKSEAVAALPLMIAEAQRPQTRKTTISELWDKYTDGRDYHALSDSQRTKLGIAWKRLEPLWPYDVAHLTVDDLQSVVDSATETFYPARDMKVALSHIYSLAQRMELVTVNKAELIELPPAPKAKRQVWTVDEVAAMWKDFESHPFTAYVLIMCYAGLRFGELAQLRIENIHLDDDYMIGGIKTEAGIDREIPIHARIKPIIAELIPQHKTKLLEMNEDTFYERYWQLVDRAQLRRLPPQTCRHYYFSAMTAAGIQGGIIAETGGHASFLTTMKNYVRIPLKDKLDAVNKIK